MIRAFAALLGCIVAIVIARWNRARGGYTGERPNRWKIALAAFLLLAGLLAFAQVLRGTAQQPWLQFAFATFYFAFAGWACVTEFRGERRPSAPQRNANPWKILWCFILLGRGVTSLLRQQRDILDPANVGALIGTVIATILVTSIAAVGLSTEYSYFKKSNLNINPAAGSASSGTQPASGDTAGQ